MPYNNERIRTGLYLLLTFAWTWGCWITLAASGVSPADAAAGGSPLLLLWPLGQYGPCIAVLMMSLSVRLFPRISSGTPSPRPWLLSGSFRPYFRAPRWYLALLLPLLWIAPVWLYAALTGTGGLPQTEGAALLQAFLPAVLFSIGEEVGWRGYLLPALLQRRSPLAASLLLGGIWGVWHLPILVFSVYESLLQFAGFVAGYLPALMLWSVVFTWVYERTGRSLWMVTGLHGSFTAAYSAGAPALAQAGPIGSLLPLLAVLLLVGVLVSFDRKGWFTAPGTHRAG